MTELKNKKLMKFKEMQNKIISNSNLEEPGVMYLVQPTEGDPEIQDDGSLKHGCCICQG
jgi:hypothetical protein